ncbi:hypothetical protein [Zavarzinella formosa]|uniref:hypothetical protein n=1 Tax=Zavarzinella formosa TaxID=360055 RepID=UPI0012F9F8AD|nr:hypothetical protein [Zavarzinella formosa]
MKTHGRMRGALMLGWAFLMVMNLPAAGGEYAELRVIDAETKRGLPLVELTTVNELKFVTDNAGRIAFREPDLMGTEVFFSVRGHGYEAPKDGFGISGVRVTPKAGEVVEIPLKRMIVAHRLTRLTGEGKWRDTKLLGHPVPLADSPNPGQVAGQDSIQAAVYRGKVYWFWGDTNQIKYPLGLYRTAGATTAIPDGDISNGLPYDYFTDKTGFARAMMPLSERPEGVIWIFGVCAVADGKNGEKLIGHYSRRKGLNGELEQGIAVFDDDKNIFTVARQLPLDEKWRYPRGHPIIMEEGGQRWLMFGAAIPNIRVPATLAAVLDPAQYEAFACQFDKDGKPEWRWQKELPPTDSDKESKLLKAGKLRPEDARFTLVDANGKDRIVLHTGSVRWNDFRKKWVLVACRIGGQTSHLGEVWYAEADSPVGPFTPGVRVAMHDRQTFYNVGHHAFLDRDGGRTIYFEGTYTNDFSGNPYATPRYNYNQVMYRLDLAAPELKVIQGK